MGLSGPVGTPWTRLRSSPLTTQGLSRVQQMALVRIPTKYLEAAVREPTWSARSKGASGAICPVAAVGGRLGARRAHGCPLLRGTENERALVNRVASMPK
jgi:hypothetical protein